jgi:hypothetical protein
VGVNLAGLLQGLTTAATGAQAGIADRKELERQARMQLLAQRLQEAQIGHLQAQTLKAQQPTAPKAPVMGSPEWLEAHRKLLALTADVKANVKLTPGERRAAQQVVIALKNMKRLYAKDKTAAQTPWQTVAAEGLGHLPFGIGAAAKGLTGPAGQRAMTPAQAEFQRNAVALRHHYAAILPHTRLSLGLLEDVNKSMVPPSGTSDEAIASGFAPAWDATLGQIEPLVGDTGAAQPAPSPVVPATVTRPSYNKKFWTKP